MISKTESGRAAEQLVADYLRNKGYIIAKMNYHSRFGEIDVIAESRTELLFVEVKLRSENAIVSPAAAVDYHKQRKIILTANDFLSKTNLTELQPRFDVAEVFLENTPEENSRFRINYIENAFEA